MRHYRRDRSIHLPGLSVRPHGRAADELSSAAHEPAAAGLRVRRHGSGAWRLPPCHREKISLLFVRGLYADPLIMEWHEIRDPQDSELDRLAERYRLHPLHIEDCRHRNQNAKVEETRGYLFAVLKTVQVAADGSL